MKKVFHLFVLFLLATSNFFAQKHDPVNLNEVENNLLNVVFDNYGNKYSLTDIIIKKERDLQTQNRVIDPICNSGIFNLHFTAGSGMLDGEHPDAAARRNVVCQVFSDLSNFINTPLHNATNLQRVEIWVRDINPLLEPTVSNPMPAQTSNVLGMATGFYNLPSSPTAVNGGIADNEIWKTIHSGVDSYTNVISPLSPNAESNNFYHGIVAINFSNPTIHWLTNLNTPIAANQYDLYSVVLHEVLHALGFASLIDSNGQSRFGNGFNYYTRYDTFLQDLNGVNLISNTGACSPMYDYNYTVNTSHLTHNCSNPYLTDSTDCATTIQYDGTNTIPVYRPACFENGSSLSHFEDQCYTSTIGPAPHGNNRYFVMSNANGNGVMKRFIKPEERNTLCDIGYDLQTSFGNASILNGTYNYGGTNSCGGIQVAGVNDGIIIDTLTGTTSFAYTGTTTGSPIQLTNILGNDFGANEYECLEVVIGNNGIITDNSGNNTMTPTYISNQPGLHLLRYVPKNGNVRGNITYIYVFLTNNCGIASTCNLVINGDFEQHSQAPNNISQINLACNWIGISGTADYFDSNYGVPCNFMGHQVVSSFTNNYNIGSSYVGIRVSSNFSNEVFGGRLKNRLNANSDYTFSIDLSQSERVHMFSGHIQILLSNSNIINPTTIASGILLDIDLNNVNTQDWTNIITNFNTENNNELEFIFIGNFQNTAVVANNSVVNFPVCGQNVFNANQTYYYIDNVSLIQINNASLNLPEDICSTSNLTDLTAYLNAANPEGTFTGTGVVQNGNVFSFSPSLAGIGTHTITYTLNQSCTIVLTDTITVTAQCANSCGGIATTWNGTSWSNGIPTLNDDVVINGNYDTTTNGNINACNLTVVSNNNLLIQSGDFVTIQNDLTVQPNASFEIMDDGSLVQINDIGVNTGNIIHHRSVMMKQYDYVYWSSPVNGFNTNSISPNTPTSLIWKWNPTNLNSNGTEGNWNNAANNIMTAGKGYIVRSPSSFNTPTPQLFTATFNNGVPHNGIILKSISRGSIETPGILVATDGKEYTRYSDNFNLIGNPYPSSIDAISFLSHPDNLNIEGKIFLWTHGTSPSNSIGSPYYQNFAANYTPNDYITFNATGTQSGPNTFNGKIASGQGFMVLMEDGPLVQEDDSVNVTFNNSMRSSGNDNSNFFKQTNLNPNTENNNEQNRIWLDLVSSNNSSERTLFGYVSNATNNYDRMYDARNSGSKIYTVLDTDNLVIQGRSLPFSSSDEVSIGIKISSQGNYTIALHAVDGLFLGSQTIYLKDTELNIYHNLKVSPYNFTSSLGVFNNRFKVVYTAPNTTQLTNIQCNSTLPVLNTVVNANNITNAQSYNWIVINTTTNVAHSFTTSVRAFQFTNASLNFPLAFVGFNTTYKVIVRAVINGIPQPYGNECTVTTPNPNTKLKTNLCSGAISLLSSPVIANSIPFAFGYCWKVTNLNTNQTMEFGTTSAWFYFTTLQNPPTNFVTFDTNYNISVAVRNSNGDCLGFGDVCQMSTPNPITEVKSNLCGATIDALNTPIYCNSINFVSGYCWQVTKSTTNETFNFQTTTNYFRLTTIPGAPSNFAEFETTYYVSAAGRNIDSNLSCLNIEKECLIKTPSPSTQLTNAYCSSTINELSSNIYANSVYGASGYCWEVTNLSTNQVVTFQTNSSYFKLTAIPSVPPYFASFGTNYFVRVAIRNGNGVCYPLGNKCLITTSTPYTQLTEEFCGNNVYSLSSPIYASNVSNSPGYCWHLINSSIGEETYFETINPSFILSNLQNVSNEFAAPNNHYDVKVSPKNTDLHCLNNGNGCSFTTYEASQKLSNYINNQLFIAIPIPNPFSNEFSLQIKSKSDELITIKVYDMIGKLLDNYATKFENIGDLSFGRNYPAGFYNIIITQGNNVEKLKIIKK